MIDDDIRNTLDIYISNTKAIIEKVNLSIQELQKSSKLQYYFSHREKLMIERYQNIIRAIDKAKIVDEDDIMLHSKQIGMLRQQIQRLATHGKKSISELNKLKRQTKNNDKKAELQKITDLISEIKNLNGRLASHHSHEPVSTLDLFIKQIDELVAQATRLKVKASGLKEGLLVKRMQRLIMLLNRSSDEIGIASRQALDEERQDIPATNLSELFFAIQALPMVEKAVDEALGDPELSINNENIVALDEQVHRLAKCCERKLSEDTIVVINTELERVVDLQQAVVKDVAKEYLFTMGEKIDMNLWKQVEQLNDKKTDLIAMLQELIATLKNSGREIIKLLGVSEIAQLDLGAIMHQEQTFASAYDTLSQVDNSPLKNTVAPIYLKDKSLSRNLTDLEAIKAYRQEINECITAIKNNYPFAPFKQFVETCQSLRETIQRKKFGAKALMNRLQELIAEFNQASNYTNHHYYQITGKRWHTAKRYTKVAPTINPVPTL